MNDFDSIDSAGESSDDESTSVLSVDVGGTLLGVPDDVALAGFDDFEWADLFEPRLTVMAQPCAAIGQSAAALLARRIADPTAPPETVRLAPRLVVRASCGAGQGMGTGQGAAR